MKILTTHSPGGAWAFVTDGFLNAFRACGHTAERWNGNPTTWKAFDPDLYIGCSGHKQPIPPVRRAKVAIHTNPFGSSSIPGIDEPHNTITWVKQQRPNAVFGYGHPSDAPYWSKWTQQVAPWVPMATAGDATIFSPRNVPRNIPVGYLGGRWDYKAKNIDAYLLPVFKSVRSVVHGWGGWPPGVSAGKLDDARVPDLFSSSKVCPCIVEPHTTQWGIDLPERVFKVILCGALAIHDPVKGLERFIPSIVMARNPQEFLELVRTWSSDAKDEERSARAAQQRKEVLAAHTYFHRMAGLLAQVGFKSEADHMLNHVSRIVP